MGFVLLLAAGLLLHLGTRPLEFEEPRRALVALEMGLRGNLIVPTTNGGLYLNKPPLFNWVLLACMRLFGSGAEWVLRLPTVASMLLLGLVLWRVARRHLQRETALLAAGFLLTFPTLLFYGTLYGEIDVFYALLAVVQALAIFVFEQRRRPLALFLVSYLAAAAGVLTKGVPSLVVQGLTLAVWLVHVRKVRWLFSWAHLAGLGVFALCVGGYFAAYSRTADVAPYLARLVFDATERTAAGPAHGAGQAALQLVAFPVQVLSLCAPWSIFAPGLFVRSARARIRSTPFLRFCVAFLAANAAPYWLSPGNRPRYMFMFLPFLASLLAVAAEELSRAGWTARAVRWLLGLSLAGGALLAVCLPFTPWGGRISPLWLWAAMAAGLAALAVRHGRAGTLRASLALALLGLAAARIGYDLIVPAIRRERSPDVFYEEVALVLNREYRDRTVRLLGEIRQRPRTIPLTGLTFTYREPEWFSMSLSYHYTLGRQELLRYAEELEPGELYLAHIGFELSRPHQVIRTFRCPAGRDQDLKLIRLGDEPP